MFLLQAFMLLVIFKDDQDEPVGVLLLACMFSVVLITRPKSEPARACLTLCAWVANSRFAGPSCAKHISQHMLGQQRIFVIHKHASSDPPNCAVVPTLQEHCFS